MSATTSPLSDAHELCRFEVEGLAELYAAGALSPLEVATATLERADAINPLFNAFTFIDREGALEAARASEARWRERRPLSRIDGVHDIKGHRVGGRLGRALRKSDDRRFAAPRGRTGG